MNALVAHPTLMSKQNLNQLIQIMQHTKTGPEITNDGRVEFSNREYTCASKAMFSLLSKGVRPMNDTVIFTKDTAAKILGFPSVSAFNKKMIELGIFHSNKLPACNYERLGYFKTKNIPYHNKQTGSRGHNALVTIRQAGLELIKEALKHDDQQTPSPLRS